MKKNFFLVFFLLVFPALTWAAQLNIDQTTKDICNQVILNIYRDIMAVKDKYPELADFGEKSFYQNQYGIYAIVYKYHPKVNADDPNAERRPSPFAFGVTIDGLKDESFKKEVGRFGFSFSLLKIKIAGFQKNDLLRARFDVQPFIQDQGVLLNNHQQNYLPLRLSVNPLKDKFKVREDIEFEVVLTNTTKSNLVVKPLNFDNLSFYINGRLWGGQFWNQSGAQSWASMQDGGLLKGGESMRLTIKGESFQFPKEVLIRAVYNVAIDGVNPTAEIKVRVVR